ncbi:S1C family serine protease [Glycomyces salinus]|uniref:S1C family serine protease n=1 Tax=Glycomyces salinus TaxID=980294 RepID=UPI0018EA4B17|nr:trypsin-like peptidase domain-containing protein [Glycomyces salinus]
MSEPENIPRPEREPGEQTPSGQRPPQSEPEAAAEQTPQPQTPQSEPAGQTRVLAGAGAPAMSAPGQAPPAWHPQGPPPGYGMPGAPVSPPKKGRGKLVAAALALVLISGGAGGVAGWALSGGEGGTTNVQSVSMDAGNGMTYTEIVDKVTPSVVTIVTDIAEGSGVVYSDDGYIVTNNHVVDGASTVEVRFSDGDTAEAEVVATDSTQDLAVLKVDGMDDLTPIEFGDSDSLQVGDATVAIGSPLGLEGTVTTGIVSALDRTMSLGGQEDSPFGEQQQSAQTLSGLIQTDAAINSGNSGGALVNGEGELIGINTAIVTPSSGNVGLGFAIPSDTVQDVVQQLIENGSVEQGFLGVSLADTQGNGAMVVEVEPDSPAAEAGLEAGDVITAIDGTAVTGASEVAAMVQSTPSGTEVAIDYTRNDEEQSTQVTLSSR